MPLVKTPRFEINDNIMGKFLNGKNVDMAFFGTIVHIFKKLEIPSKKKLFKYYGPDIVNPKYARLFGPMYEDRIVLKKCGKKKSYIIFPMSGYNRYFTFNKL